MTRKEQIKEAAADHRDCVCCGFDDSTADAQEESFIEGAEWADKTMINEACDMLYAMLSTQDIHGSVYVTAPAYDNVVDFVQAFRKALEK